MDTEDLGLSIGYQEVINQFIDFTNHHSELTTKELNKQFEDIEASRFFLVLF